jgi:dihydroxyacetone kinase DhaKLM complex PTS-EIIA-like component DhaM
MLYCVGSFLPFIEKVFLAAAMSKSESMNAPSSNAAALTVIGGDDTGQINFDFAQVDENIAKRLSDEDLRDIFAIH